MVSNILVSEPQIDVVYYVCGLKRAIECSLGFILNHVLNLIHLRTIETFSGQISTNSQKLFSFLEIKLIEGLCCLNSCRIQKLLSKEFIFRLKIFTTSFGLMV